MYSEVREQQEKCVLQVYFSREDAIKLVLHIFTAPPTRLFPSFPLD